MWLTKSSKFLCDNQVLLCVAIGRDCDWAVRVGVFEMHAETKKKEDGGLSDVLKMAGGVSKIDFS